MCDFSTYYAFSLSLDVPSNPLLSLFPGGLHDPNLSPQHQLEREHLPGHPQVPVVAGAHHLKGEAKKIVTTKLDFQDTRLGPDPTLCST